MKMNTNNQRNHRRSRHSNNRPNKLVCSFCKQLKKPCEGHNIRSCPVLADIVCPNCNTKGHTIKYCPDPTLEKCNFCKRVGHLENACHFNPLNKIPQCSNCRKFGHKYEECFYVSGEDKQKYKDKIQMKKQEEEYKQKLSKEKEEIFKKNGFTYSESSLKFYLEQFELDKNFIPWIIYCNEDEEYDSMRKGLTKKEQKELDNIKFQVNMFKEMVF